MKCSMERKKGEGPYFMRHDMSIEKVGHKVERISSNQVI